MMSKIPPVSPASIMLVVRSSNMLGYWRIALARVAPPSTVVRTPVSVFWKVGFSWLAARISRHCTRGRPASIITENWRKKIAMSLVLTLALPNIGRENSFPFSRIEPGVTRSRRSCAANTCLLAATRSPVIFSPDAFLPENVKTGMVSLSLLRCTCLPAPWSVWRRTLHLRCAPPGQSKAGLIFIPRLTAFRAPRLSPSVRQIGLINQPRGQSFPAVHPGCWNAWWRLRA